LFEKVIYNLIDNSKRHGETVTDISITYEVRSKALFIIYRDNGRGISRDEKDKIFQKGYRRNTGLVLFLIREILRITNITISENGEPGAGARFEIQVPEHAWKYSNNGNPG